ncbi:MAG TPA: T9SS type A sorting domain-containing protein [Edaphocola sp.]|nr:T9SS type A sorting domain-containing protein [Edaphocola sp.]
MKKIITSLVLALGVAYGAMAQKNVDLAFSVTNPGTEFQAVPNVAGGDSLQFNIQIANNGTAAVVASDSIVVWQLGYLYKISGQNLINYVWEGRLITGVSIPAGQSYTHSFYIKKGAARIAQNGDTVINYFIDNDTNFIKAEGYGWESNGNLFTDPGVDNNDPDGENGLTGNNTTTRNYIMGASTGTKNVGTFKFEALNVYPNPSNGNLNISYNFKNNSEANVRVFDLSGKVVFTKNLGTISEGTKNFNLDMNTLSTGFYTIELITNEGTAVGRFNIKK